MRGRYVWCVAQYEDGDDHGFSVPEDHLRRGDFILNSLARENQRVGLCRLAGSSTRNAQARLANPADQLGIGLTTPRWPTPASCVPATRLRLRKMVGGDGIEPPTLSV